MCKCVWAEEDFQQNRSKQAWVLYVQFEFSLDGVGVRGGGLNNLGKFSNAYFVVVIIKSYFVGKVVDWKEIEGSGAEPGRRWQVW